MQPVASSPEPTSNTLVEVTVPRVQFSPPWMLQPFSRLVRWPRSSGLLPATCCHRQTRPESATKPKPVDTTMDHRCVRQKRIMTCPAVTAKKVLLLKDFAPLTAAEMLMCSWPPNAVGLRALTPRCSRKSTYGSDAPTRNHQQRPADRAPEQSHRRWTQTLHVVCVTHCVPQ